ncbi:MAG TPA: hypothetical protein VI072_12435 [Polyangiaceae bacterium]
MSIYQKFLIPVLCLTPLLACSESSDDGDGGGTGETCPHDYSNYTAPAEPVSLRDDLLKAGGTLRFSCSFNTTCHGNEDRNEADLYLGTSGNDALTDTQIDLIHSIVNKPSLAAPTIPLVVPGKPEESFLMMKLDGCLDDVSAKCEGTSSNITEHACGSLMPEGNTKPVPKQERDLIRAWIKQGAQKN